MHTYIHATWALSLSLSARDRPRSSSPMECRLVLSCCLPRHLLPLPLPSTQPLSPPFAFHRCSLRPLSTVADPHLLPRRCRKSRPSFPLRLGFILVRLWAVVFRPTLSRSSHCTRRLHHLVDSQWSTTTVNIWTMVNNLLHFFYFVCSFDIYFWYDCETDYRIPTITYSVDHYLIV